MGQLGLEMVRGLQARRVVSTPKHYAAYSSPVGGRDDATRTDPHITEQALHELYLEPFRRAVQDGIPESSRGWPWPRPCSATITPEATLR